MMDLGSLIHGVSALPPGSWVAVAVVAVAVVAVVGALRRRRHNPVVAARRRAAGELKRGRPTAAAEALLSIGEREEALQLLVRAGAWLRAADVALEMGRRDRAASLYERAGKYAEAAKLLEEVRQYEPAAKLYARAGKPMHAAEILERLGRHEEAAELYQQAGNLRAAAEIRWKRKQFAEAADLYDAAFSEERVALREGALDPKRRESIMALARRAAEAAVKANRYERAYAVLLEIGDRAGAAELAAKRGRVDEAVRLYREAGQSAAALAALRAAGREKEALLLEAEMREEEGEIEEAGRLFARGGDYGRAADLLGRAGRFAEAAALAERGGDAATAAAWYLKAKDGAKAAESYERAGVYDRAAALYQRLGNRAKAIELLTKGGQHFEAAMHLAQDGQMDKALGLLAMVPDGSPDGRRARVAEADLWLRKGDRRRALDLYERGLKGQAVHISNVDAFYRWAILAESAGAKDKARALFRDILKHDPDFRDVRARFEALAPTKSTETESARSSGKGRRRYVTLEELGRGGMGVVYKAMDRVLDRVVALKVLPSDLAKNEQVVRNFFREARAAAALSHPNIVTVFDAGEEDDVYYIAMEFIQGPTLKQIVREKGPLAAGPLIDFAIQIARGLGYAHAHKILHRDIKPSNMMLLERDQIVKITDFGLAKVIQEVVNFQTVVGGTPHYMSPEQILGEEIDPRSDLYSLGASLYELATGSVPFPKGDTGYHHIHTPPPDARALRPELDAAFAQIVIKLMQKDPGDRYASAAEVVAALEASRMEKR